MSEDEQRPEPTKDAPGPAPTTDEVVLPGDDPVKPTEGGSQGDIRTKGFESEPHQ